MSRFYSLPICLLFFLLWFQAKSQVHSPIEVNTAEGFTIVSDSGRISVPLFSFKANDRLYSSADVKVSGIGNNFSFSFSERIKGSVSEISSDSISIFEILVFNRGKDTLMITDLLPIPLERKNRGISIATDSKGQSWLVSNNKKLVRVILPSDRRIAFNAHLRKNKQSCGFLLSVSSYISPGIFRLLPADTLKFKISLSEDNLPWQTNLKKLSASLFPNASIAKRTSKSYSPFFAVMMKASSNLFYDDNSKKFGIYDFINNGKKYYGGYDIAIIDAVSDWYGLDGKSEVDLYQNLPSGIDKLKDISNYLNNRGTSLFSFFEAKKIDTSQFKSLSDYIEKSGMHGIFTDKSSLQESNLYRYLEKNNPNCIFFNDGVIIPQSIQKEKYFLLRKSADEPFVNIGEVLNPVSKYFIHIDANGVDWHNSIANAFFNGMGLFIDMKKGNYSSDFFNENAFIKHCYSVLRENDSCLNSGSYVPFINTSDSSLLAVSWRSENKTVYNYLYQTSAKLAYLQVDSSTGHYVDIFNDMELSTYNLNGNTFIPAPVNNSDHLTVIGQKSFSVGSIVNFRKYIYLNSSNDSVEIKVNTGNRILVSYRTGIMPQKSILVSDSLIKVPISTIKGDDLIIKLFANNELIDEVIFKDTTAICLLNKVIPTSLVSRAPEGMTFVKGGLYSFIPGFQDSFCSFCSSNDTSARIINSFYMDIYPVTNEQFYNFIRSSGYVPKDSHNYLRNWINGMYPAGQANYPVVYINLDDARAYAKWAGKRLPTEREWQYAAQGNDFRAWPWGNEFQATRCNNGFSRPTPVNAFPKGKSPFGIADMVGNVWQFMDDEYHCNLYDYIVLKGGSFYTGPVAVTSKKILPRLSASYERSENVGFRCVTDAADNAK